MANKAAGGAIVASDGIWCKIKKPVVVKAGSFVMICEICTLLASALFLILYQRR